MTTHGESGSRPAASTEDHGEFATEDALDEMATLRTQLQDATEALAGWILYALLNGATVSDDVLRWADYRLQGTARSPSQATRAVLARDVVPDPDTPPYKIPRAASFGTPAGIPCTGIAPDAPWAPKPNITEKL